MHLQSIYNSTSRLASLCACPLLQGGDIRELDFRFYLGDTKIGAPFHGLRAFFTTPQARRRQRACVALVERTGKGKGMRCASPGPWLRLPAGFAVQTANPPQTRRAPNCCS